MAISARSSRFRHFGDRGIRDEDRATARQHQRNADQAVARLVVDHALDLFQRDRKIAGYSGHHGVGVARRDHGGGIMVAVVVDDALAIPHQEALALQALIEHLRIGALRWEMRAL